MITPLGRSTFANASLGMALCASPPLSSTRRTDGTLSTSSSSTRTSITMALARPFSPNQKQNVSRERIRYTYYRTKAEVSVFVTDVIELCIGTESIFCKCSVCSGNISVKSSYATNMESSHDRGVDHCWNHYSPESRYPNILTVLSLCCCLVLGPLCTCVGVGLLSRKYRFAIPKKRSLVEKRGYTPYRT